MTRPTGSPKYGTTRKNTQRYYTTKRLIRYIYKRIQDGCLLCFVERKAPYVNGKRNDEVKRTRRETSNAVRGLESRAGAKKEGKTPIRGESRNETYYPTAHRKVQITPKTSTNITRYLYSRGPVRQVSWR